MQVYFVMFNTSFGEKGIWGISSTPATAIKLAEETLDKQGWQYLSFISLEEKGNIGFIENDKKEDKVK